MTQDGRENEKTFIFLHKRVLKVWLNGLKGFPLLSVWETRRADEITSSNE